MQITPQDHQELQYRTARVQQHLRAAVNELGDLCAFVNRLAGERFDGFDDPKQAVCAHMTPIGDYCAYCVEIHDTPEG